MGFVRVIAISAILGTTELATAFSQSNAMSNVLFELLAGGALSAALVPAIVAADDRRGSVGVEGIAQGILGIALTILGGATVIALILRGPIAAMITSAAEPRVRQESAALVEYWLMWFLPQVLLYAWGAIAIAVLTARRKLGVIGAAPIGNTVVLITCMVIARVIHGSAFGAGTAGLHIGSAEKVWLGIAGTGGVLAFVALPVLSARRSGVRLRPRWGWTDRNLRVLLRSISWSVLQTGAVGVLLLGANIASAERRGGAQIYAFALACFYAPFAIFAQPVQTAAQPDLVRLAQSEEFYVKRLNVALRSTLASTILIAIASFGLVLPAMRGVLFGATHAGDARGYAFALAGLMLGLPAYSVFMLLTRARYALGDTRSPAVIALTSAVLAAVGMQVLRVVLDGDWVLAGIGASVSLAWISASAVLIVRSVALRHAFAALDWRDLATRSVVPGCLIAAVGLVLDGASLVSGSRWSSLLLAGIGGGVAALMSHRRLRLKANA
ncbi:MAG: lipid II flippase MurJ [Acidimicrobiia bacterium]